jgi:drug/metabolite transporter superfamily protein YnfA
MIKLLGRLFATLIIGLAAAWAAGALYFDLPARPVVRDVAAVAWFVGAFIGWFCLPHRRWSRTIVGLVFLCILGWWLSISPRQDRDWKPDVAVLPNAIIDGDQVTINNVRNFDWRSLTDFTPRYETRTYNLSRLLGADLFVIYWGSPLIAHTIASFNFGDQGRICFSIETRPERGKAYSAIGGLYRQFELIYVAVDERDAIRVRTNFRKDEEAYLYHLNLPREEVRARFLEYLRRMNELHARPEWYNAITSNCTTNIRTQHVVAKPHPWDWRILVNGKGDELLYKRGVLDRSVPFAELKRRAHINSQAQAADNAPDFSERIRSDAARDAVSKLNHDS